MAKKPIGWLTRDADGEVLFWAGKQPLKDMPTGCWDSESNFEYVKLGKCKQMKMVKWSDEKPRAVEDFILLGEAE